MTVRTVFVTALAMTAALCTLGGQAEYTADAAMSALQFAKASYCDANDIRSWSCASCKAHPSFSAPRVYTDSAVGTQAYIGLDAGRVVVAFRGSTNTQNWIKNLDFIRTKYDNCILCQVHTGFWGSYQSLMKPLLQGVQELINANSNYSILIAGHSLGGAMATLAAADIAQLSYSSGTRPHIDLYTFGSPRVGNQYFADWFADLLCSGGHASYRVTHKRDMVPHLPPQMFGFVHVSREYFYNNDIYANWTKCNDIKGSSCTDQKISEDEKCSESLYSNSIEDHLLYLGTCTSCSCGADWLDAMQNFELSARQKIILAADYMYRRVQKKFY